jgi:hypothetical protein
MDYADDLDLRLMLEPLRMVLAPDFVTVSSDSHHFRAVSRMLRLDVDLSAGHREFVALIGPLDSPELALTDLLWEELLSGGVDEDAHFDLHGIIHSQRELQIRVEILVDRFQLLRRELARDPTLQDRAAKLAKKLRAEKPAFYPARRSSPRLGPFRT